MFHVKQREGAGLPDQLFPLQSVQKVDVKAKHRNGLNERVANGAEPSFGQTSKTDTPPSTSHLSKPINFS